MDLRRALASLKGGFGRAPKQEKSRDQPHSYFAGKEFTEDWTSNKLDLWLPVLSELVARPVNILEVGTFEGRSAILFLETLPKSKITCIDHFHRRPVENRFDRNTAEYGDRVRKIKGRAVGLMGKLLDSGEKFDLIYLDAAKERAGAFIVSALAWAMLKNGGIIMWDDLGWRPDKPPAERPEPGSRLFMSTFSECMTLIHDKSLSSRWHGQAIAQKTKDWPHQSF